MEFVIIPQCQKGGKEMNIPLKIKILESGRTQRDIARNLEIEPSRLSEFIQGWREPDLDMKERLAKDLGCKIADIFS